MGRMQRQRRIERELDGKARQKISAIWRSQGYDAIDCAKVVLEYEFGHSAKMARMLRKAFVQVCADMGRKPPLRGLTFLSDFESLYED